MATRVPVFRPLHLPALLLHIAIQVAVFCIAWRLTDSPQSAAFCSLAVVGYSLLMRSLLAVSHRRGVRLMRAARYEEAVEAFRASHAFFTRHAWIDRYRAVTMFSAASMSYREMALINLAFAYSQLGDGRAAKEFYQLALRDFPNSGMAQAALRLIESVEQTQAVSS